MRVRNSILNSENTPLVRRLLVFRIPGYNYVLLRTAALRTEACEPALLRRTLRLDESRERGE